MKTDKVLQVLYKERRVGTLGMGANRKIAFAYEDDWIENGFSISPFSLPLKKQGNRGIQVGFGRNGK